MCFADRRSGVDAYSFCAATITRSGRGTPPVEHDSIAAEATRIGMRVVPRLGVSPGVAPGSLIGRYRLEREIGRGGMGVVFRAEHVHLRRIVALKILAPHLCAEAMFRERFIRESQTAAALRHPHIVAVHDAGEARGMLFLAMQLVEGGDLGERVAGGWLEPARAIAWLGQIASALDTAHAAGLVHRDVKPANILLEDGQAYLSDFGLMKRTTSQTGLTGVGQVVGSTDYLAPEQIEARAVDARTDVYGLGAVLYHCLAGAPPFARESDLQVLFAHLQQPPPPLSAIRPDLPAALSGAVARALAKDPHARHPSCTALIEDAREATVGDAAAAGASADRLPRVVTAAPRSGALIRVGVPRDEFELEELPAGVSLVDAARAAPPDVLVFEANPDGPLGPEACRDLKADERTAGMCMIPVVPRAQAAFGRQLVAAGAHDYLAAPFSAIQLVVKLRDAVTRRG
jgi:CheY-like chemotaxis protein